MAWRGGAYFSKLFISAKEKRIRIWIFALLSETIFAACQLFLKHRMSLKREK
jgi:uncharacterized membrane protein